MSNLSHSQSDYFAPQENQDQFWQYIQSLTPEIVNQLSQPNSKEVFEVIQKSIIAMLGNLPNDKYHTMITTSRDELGKLLGSAMIDGYFLRNAEQRLEMEILGNS
ncbi:MAG: DUF760 domain-containing protein [Nostocales cyanobacterium]|nr:MAG: DUF760 domain-containing protein [Nostocales cyanobacterium]TAF13480.1 MAG: DUF760 domain-containing protein [Nostocales cyanobacterium]